MTPQRDKQSNGVFGNIVLTVASVYVAHEYAPIWYGTLGAGAVLNPLPAMASAIAIANIIIIAGCGFQYLAGKLDYLGSLIPKGYKGTATWMTRKELKAECLPVGASAPYWGVFVDGKKQRQPSPILADYKSNAVTFGPAGAGKRCRCRSSDVHEYCRIQNRT